jgi:hypothetical protein
MNELPKATSSSPSGITVHQSSFGRAKEDWGKPYLSNERYDRVIRKITLLKIMDLITNEEVKRLISLIESPDPENWTVCEECIKQKLS